MKRNRGNLPYIIILSVLGVIIVGLVIAIIAVNVHGEQASEEDIVSEVQTDTGLLFKNGNFEEGIKIYEDRISNTSSSKDKASLYIYLAADLLAYEKGTKEYADQISQYLHMAEQIYPSVLSASMLCIYGDNDSEKKNYCDLEEARYLALPESERMPTDE